MAGGKAQITASFDAWKDGKVASSHHMLEVIPLGHRPRPEPVSRRLKRSLMHPIEGSSLAGLRFAPDGKRILAADRDGKALQVWDADSGKQWARIDIAPTPMSPPVFGVSPDWKNLVSPITTWHNVTVMDRRGKEVVRPQRSGMVCAWDLDNGRRVRTFAQDPAHRGLIQSFELSPLGTTFVTSEYHLVPRERAARSSITLWDVKTGHRQVLRESQGFSRFSPDGKLLAVARSDAGASASAIELFDTATGRQTLAIPLDKGCNPGSLALSPDSKILASTPRNYKTGEHGLKLWDTATGRELCSLSGDKGDYFAGLVFSPDGRTLALANWRWGSGKQARLFLFDVSGRKWRKTVVLAPDKPLVYEPVFSPDGKWIAAAAQIYPEKLEFPGPHPLEMAQPRIHLIETAAGVVRETLIAPHGLPRSACFSPDSKILATSGYGKVLLWDVSGLPGS